MIRVIAAPQPVLRITHCTTHGTPFDLMRAAYHLGNRHVPIELKPDHLKIEPDHVLADMLRAMHLIVNEVGEAFEPEGGAYSAHGATGHAHEAAPVQAMPAPAAPHVHGPDCNHTHDAIKPVAIAIHPISRTAIEHALKPVTEPLPALPVSGFSYSEKLEAAVERAGVATENIASNGLRDRLGLSLARGDLAVISQAIPAWRADDLPRIRQLNDWALQTRETSELRAQAEQMARLSREIPGAVVDAMALTGDERQDFPPMLAILSSQHETQYSRLFRS